MKEEEESTKGAKGRFGAPPKKSRKEELRFVPLLRKERESSHGTAGQSSSGRNVRPFSSSFIASLS